MMLLYAIIIYLNSSVYNQKIDTTNFSSFQVKEKKYLFDGFSKVYTYNSDSLIRIDKSLDSRMSTTSYIFEHNDTVIKYGGYGFWSQRNFLFYFDFSSLEWEYYPSLEEKNIEGSFYGFQNKNDNRVIFYGGKKVNSENRLEQIPSNEIIEYNFRTRELKNKGTLNFEVQSKDKLFQSYNFDLFVDENYLYKINSLKNQVLKVNRPKIFSDFITTINYDQSEDNFTVTKINPKTFEQETIIFDGRIFNYPIETIKLYNSNSRNLYYLLLLITSIIILSLIYFTRSKKSQLYLHNDFLFFKDRKFRFSKSDVEFIRLLSEKNQINSNEILSIYSNPELTYAHNIRVANESIDRISIQLKSIFSLKNDPIKKIKSNSDRRQKVIIKSNEFETIIKKFIIK